MLVSPQRILALSWIQTNIPLVLRNPLYFVFLAMLGGGAYVTWTLNLWGPLLNMTNAATAQALEEGKKRLREFLESSETGRQAMGVTSTRNDAYEMKRMNTTKTAEPKSDDIDDI